MVAGQAAAFRGATGVDSSDYLQHLNKPHYPSLAVSEKVRKSDAGTAAAEAVLGEDTPEVTPAGAPSDAKAAASTSTSSSSAVCGAAAFQELLAPRVAACKRRCEVERAAEELHRAAAACRTLADLPKLEAAILTARKVRKGSTETWIVACFLWSGAC